MFALGANDKTGQVSPQKHAYAAMNEPATPVDGHVGPRRSAAVWFATAGGIGLIPFAPGTWGSILGIPLAWGIAAVPNPWLAAAVLVGVAAVCVPICVRAIRDLGGPHDPSCIVVDEVVGTAATLFMFDVTQPATVIAGFLLFRLFDITKPTPVREIERLPHAWGVMADDLLAALYANVSLRALTFLATWYFASEAATG